MKHYVVFGGSGFIGTHLTQHLLRLDLADTITIADLQTPRNEPYTQELQHALQDGRVRYVRCDVTTPIPTDSFRRDSDYTIINLAAIHREPGHAPEEYFRTNIFGAENVCAFATGIGCNRILFTSSISPYGPSEDVKDEQSIPLPVTPYGSSKLVAEKIHIGWQQSSSSNRLIILRPGVVFGAGEGGNVTRLVRSLVKGYFVYVGNRETRKAGGYVKELCYVVSFARERQESTGEPLILLNFSADPPPSVQAFVETIGKVAGIRHKPLSLPRCLLLVASYPASALARVFRIKQPLSPVTLRKVFRSTNVDPRGLRALGYQYHFTLESAFRDWQLDAPSDFTR